MPAGHDVGHSEPSKKRPDSQLRHCVLLAPEQVKHVASQEAHCL